MPRVGCAGDAACCWRHPKACAPRTSTDVVALDSEGCTAASAGSCARGVCSFGASDWATVPWARHKIARQRLGWLEERGWLARDTTSHRLHTRRFPNDTTLGSTLNALLVNSEPMGEMCERRLCRLGPAADGGWSVCRDSRHLVPGRRCVIYSIGISNDMRFDQAAAVAAGLGCEQHMLDHTVSSEMVRRAGRIAPGRVFFHRRGLGVHSDRSMVSLSAFMAEQKHDFIDVLKIDCEGCGEKGMGTMVAVPPSAHPPPMPPSFLHPRHPPIPAEWKVFDALARDHPDLLSRVGQLLIELHAWPNHNRVHGAARLARERRQPYAFRLDQLETFAEHVLGRHGFVVAERHLNPWNLYWNDTFSPMLPRELRVSGVSTAWACWELVLLRRRPSTTSMKALATPAFMSKRV